MNKINFKFSFTFTGYILLSSLILSINSQNITSIDNANLEYDGIFGVGWGVFAIILSLIVGLLCCIFGIATLFIT